MKKRIGALSCLLPGLGLLLASGACQKNTLPQYFVLQGLRVVDLELDQPEANPGDTVNLTPFLSDIYGGGRALTYTVTACADPGIAFGAPLTCDGQPDEVTIASSQSVPALPTPMYTGTAPSVAVTIPTTIFQGQSTVNQYNGVAYLIYYQLVAADGTNVTALKRAMVSTRTTKNTNPSFVAGQGILSNGSLLAALSPNPVNLSINITPASVETYSYMNPDGSTTMTAEVPVVSWFISLGSLDKPQAGLNQTTLWTGPTADPPGLTSLVIAVVRDQRGGTAHYVISL